ncbi:helix-turn-helix transcriptional regulator [Anaerovorax odorimutans]|uniref:Helix-turn-helix transcriptional regulator n=1 Tax=Anaerovorax odorimutans TaxID=109327 RepID=A0ABT1RNY6_9FIRM|nr:helix-turn-helix transcriptional regulator [Anaerovorax odorimutans]MCQ4636906.1 helix-turn-helix transcriptional regulator [Anaerovorax odorimutans]
MHTLSTNNWIQLTDLIYKINSIEDIRNMQDTFLKDLRTMIPFDIATFYLPSDFTEPSVPAGLDVPPEAIPAYLKNMDEDYTRWIFSLSRSMVCRESDLWSDEERKKTKYYQEVYKPYNVHFAIITGMVFENEFVGCCCLYRTLHSGDFSDREMFILDVLKDHLALSLSRRLLPMPQASSRADSFLKEIGLTKKENEVFNLLLQGLSTEEISQKLYISPNTLKNHFQSIYAKAGVKNKFQLLKKARLF